MFDTTRKIEGLYRRLDRLESKHPKDNTVVIKEAYLDFSDGCYGRHVNAVEVPIATAIQLLADAIGMKFVTEAATPSKTVLVKKAEEAV
jgi:uncharacterized protein YwlG (UPF0340 family)